VRVRCEPDPAGARHSRSVKPPTNAYHAVTDEGRDNAARQRAAAMRRYDVCCRDGDSICREFESPVRRQPRPPMRCLAATPMPSRVRRRLSRERRFGSACCAPEARYAERLREGAKEPSASLRANGDRRPTAGASAARKVGVYQPVQRARAQRSTGALGAARSAALPREYPPSLPPEAEKTLRACAEAYTRAGAG